MYGKVRGTLFFLMITLFAVLLFAYAMFQGGFVSWFLFFAFLPIFLYPLGLLLYPMKSWNVSRRLNRHIIQAGNSVNVTIRVEQPLPFPLYYCICEEMFPETLEMKDIQQDKYRFLNDPDSLRIQRTFKKMVFPWFRRVFEVSYTLDHLPRGDHVLQGIRLRTGDMFGFIRKEHVFDISDQLMVNPHARSIHMVGAINAFDQGELSSQTFQQRNTNIATGSRQYRPGDRFAWIDWKQTARRNEMMTKEFEQEKSTETMVVLDACDDENMNPLAFEGTVELALSIIRKIHQQSSKAGFLTIGAETAYMELRQDQLQNNWVTSYLAHLHPSGNQDFPQELEKEMLKMHAGVAVLIVTSRMDPSIKEALKQTAIHSKRVVLIFIQGSRYITGAVHDSLEEIRAQGVVVNVLTEKDLLEHAIGVHMV